MRSWQTPDGQAGDGDAPSSKTNVSVARGEKSTSEVLRDADGNIIKRDTLDGEGLEGGVLAGQGGPVDGSAFPDGTPGDAMGMPGGMLPIWLVHLVDAWRHDGWHAWRYDGWYAR